MGSMLANKSVETNRRPASPFDAGRQVESASCAPPSLPAAVAHLYRSAASHVTHARVRHHSRSSVRRRLCVRPRHRASLMDWASASSHVRGNCRRLRRRVVRLSYDVCELGCFPLCDRHDCYLFRYRYCTGGGRCHCRHTHSEEISFESQDRCPRTMRSTEWRPRHAAWQFRSCGGAAIGELIRSARKCTS